MSVAILVVMLNLMGCTGNDSPDGTSAGNSLGATAFQSVPDATCASCHEDIYLSYDETGMGRSMSKFDPSDSPERFDVTVVFNPASQTYYEALLRGDSLFQRAWREDNTGNRFAERLIPVDLVVGSGNATRSYLTEVNGRYTEMPLTWYVDRGAWDLSPGYDQRDQGFARPINLECMTCHNAKPTYSPHTVNHYPEVPLGIGCERCHGAGGAHVDRALAGLVEDRDSTIINPATLDRERQLSVCQQCHLTGVSVFADGEDPTTFEPGMLLSAHRSVFVEVEESTPGAQFGIASHGVRLAQSECFKLSEMTCTTCHDPHQPVASLDPDWFNARCQDCHQNEPGATTCSRDVVDPLDRLTGDCSSCHMQKGGTSDIPHVTFTDHWIRPVRTGAPPAGPIDFSERKPNPLTLIPIARSEQSRSDERVADLEKALAYFEFYETVHQLPAYLDSVVTMTSRAFEAGIDRADARLARGKAHLERGELSQALEHLAVGATLAPRDATIAYWHAVVLQRSESLDRGLAEIDRAVSIQPLFAEAHLKRGDLLSSLGRFDDAVVAYRKVIELDPIHQAEAYNNVGFLYLQRNAIAEGAAMIDESLTIDPDGVVALINAATARMILAQWAEAEPFLLRAIDIDDTVLGAYGNLGVIYMETGRRNDAKRMFEKVLDLSPGDPRAQAMLTELDRE